MLWDLPSGQLRATFRDHDRHITCVTFSPDSAMLLSGDASGKVVLRQAATPDEVDASAW